jgi:DNA-binding beta-propeller fold protein YncE
MSLAVTTMSNNQQTKISEIVSAIPVLTDSGSNWSIFKMRFTLTLEPYNLLDFYNENVSANKVQEPAKMQGTSTTPLTAEEQKAINEYNGKLAKWTKDKSMAQFILSRVIPNSML